MRVISGSRRGKKLSVPAGLTTRPTSDRVKESLFNILTNRLDLSGCQVLDICAGTGGLGIEALSRGADFCCFIEKDPSSRKILDKNLADMAFLMISRVVMMDVAVALPTLVRQGHCFDLVFFDPPYDSLLYDTVPGFVEREKLLRPGAVFVAECAVKKQLSDAYGHLRRVDRRTYGDTALELFMMED